MRRTVDRYYLPLNLTNGFGDILFSNVIDTYTEILYKEGNSMAVINESTPHPLPPFFQTK